MRKIIGLFLGLFLFSSTINAQEVNPELLGVGYWDIGIEYGFDAGLGGNVGYTDLGVSAGHISHGSFSVLYRDDGIDKWGEDYTGTVGQREFSEDIVDTGYEFITVSGLIGLKITKGVHILGIIGYRGANLVQKRFDEFTILGSNGRYYTRYRNGEKSSIGVGAGVKFFLPLSNKVALTPTVQATTLKGISMSVGLAFN